MENRALPKTKNCNTILNSQFSILNLPTAYAPNIAYISAIARSERFSVDISEPYIRQTFRNRCEILTSQGIQKLSIPIDKKSTRLGAIKDVKIDYAENWQRQHWRSLQASYSNSPYFLYYQDELRVFYEKRYGFLVEFNKEILSFVLEKIGLKAKGEGLKVASPLVELSDNGEAPFALRPSPFALSQFKTYQQTFSPEKFIENLSSFDLLFNCGPESKKYLL